MASSVQLKVLALPVLLIAFYGLAVVEVMGEEISKQIAEGEETGYGSTHSWGVNTGRGFGQQASNTHLSYGSLNPDRVLCPPMSGMSYYNPHCRSLPSSGPVNPYERGCSTLSRCSRDTS
eukprot:c11370_g1_i1 orf=392-751(-)